MTSRSLFPVLICLLALLSACDESPAPGAPDPAEASLNDTARWGKRLAAEQCDSCHAITTGKPGQKVPFITGQNAVYLKSALDSYQKQDREHEQMNSAVATLSEQEKDALAAWYSSSKSPWAGKATLGKLVLHEFREPAVIDKGKAVASPCFSCHGQDGNSIKEGVPSLAGLQPSYFKAALKAYTTGERQGAQVMKNFKLALNDVMIRDLAAYFTHQKRSRSTLTGGAGNARTGERKAAPCFGCHGRDGNSYNPQFPGLAGQNAVYLEKAILHYQKGNRTHPLMKTAVKGLSEADIRDIAAWYASREPSSAVQVRSAGETEFAPLQQGETLARACNGCHGEHGISGTPGIPSLAGYSEPYLYKAIIDYRSGARRNEVMALQVKSLDDHEIEKIALYYASLSPVPPPPDAAEMMRREQLGIAQQQAPPNPPLYIADCNGCHGNNGNSEDPGIPRLAGQDSNYLARAMNAYAGGERDNEDMAKAISALNVEQRKAAAHYYSLVTPIALPFRAPESLEQIVARCNRCHGEGGFVSDPKIPRIAGQAYDYLTASLARYRKRERKSSIMEKMTADLTPLELDAAARYYAGK